MSSSFRTSPEVDDVRVARRLMLASRVLRRAVVLFLLVVPMAMYAVSLAESSRAVGWGLLLVLALAGWWSADALSVRAGWHAVPGQRRSRVGDEVLLAMIDLGGAAALAVAFGWLGDHSERVPDLASVPGAFLLYELAWLAAASALMAVVASVRSLGSENRWLAPMHLTIAVGAFSVAESRALPDTTADDLVFSLFLAVVLLLGPVVLRRVLAAVRG